MLTEQLFETFSVWSLPRVVSKRAMSSQKSYDCLKSAHELLEIFLFLPIVSFTHWLLCYRQLVSDNILSGLSWSVWSTNSCRVISVVILIDIVVDNLSGLSKP